MLSCRLQPLRAKPVPRSPVHHLHVVQVPAAKLIHSASSPAPSCFILSLRRPWKCRLTFSTQWSVGVERAQPAQGRSDLGGCNALQALIMAEPASSLQARTTMDGVVNHCRL